MSHPSKRIRLSSRTFADLPRDVHFHIVLFCDFRTLLTIRLLSRYHSRILADHSSPSNSILLLRSLLSTAQAITGSGFSPELGDACRLVSDRLSRRCDLRRWAEKAVGWVEDWVGGESSLSPDQRRTVVQFVRDHVRFLYVKMWESEVMENTSTDSDVVVQICEKEEEMVALRYTSMNASQDSRDGMRLEHYKIFDLRTFVGGAPPSQRFFSGEMIYCLDDYCMKHLGEAIDKVLKRSFQPYGLGWLGRAGVLVLLLRILPAESYWCEEYGEGGDEIQQMLREMGQ